MGSADIDFDDLTSPKLTDVQRQILEFTEAKHVEFDIDRMLAEAVLDQVANAVHHRRKRSDGKIQHR